jgi:hypothetical protein
MRHVTVIHKAQPFNVEVSCASVPEGATLEALAPSGRVVCRVNSANSYVPRSQWGAMPRAGDVVEFIEYPFGGKDDAPFATFLLAAIASIASMNPYPLFLAFASVAMAMGREGPAELQKDESPTYATGVQGNRARMYDVVPKWCGYCRMFPSYAAEPYKELHADGEEYLYVLLALSIDGVEIQKVQIEDTDLSYFSDVISSRYLPPGEQPQDVLANVLTSTEVGTQELLTGRVVGPFNICPAQFTVQRIGVVIAGPRGINVADSDGTIGGLEVSWRVDVAEVDQFGTRIENWQIVAIETETAASREVVRWDKIYNIDPPRRVMVRVTRLDVKSNNARYANELVWAGLRAYLNEPAPLNENVGHLEVVVRSSKQLTGITQNRIAVVGTGYAHELLPDGTQGDLIVSRNAADYLADLHTSDTWGEGLSIESLDVTTLVALKQKWSDRQDRCDFIFDTTIDANEAAQILAGTGRARAFRRNGVRTFWRDELVTLPRVAFTTRNTRPASMSETNEFPRDRTPDGVIVEYFDNRTWNFGRPIECPCPGVTYMTDPVRIRLQGITGRIHATREGLFEAAKLAYRRSVVQCTQELQGMLPAIGTAARWQTEQTRWVAGDVVEYDPATRLARLSEPVEWDTAQKSIVLVQNDGTPTAAIAVTPGNLTTEVILATDPGFDLSTDYGYRDRTQYLLGTPEQDDLLVKVAGIADGGLEDGAQLYDINAFVDDERCHTVDLHLLPSPGEIQDPIDGDEGAGEEVTIPVVNLTDQSIGQSSAPGVPNDTSLEFFANGLLGGSYTGYASPIVWPNQWLVVAPVDPEVVSVLFEVRFTIIEQQGLTAGAEYADTWLPADQFYRFTVASGLDPAYATILIEIRDVAQQILQDSATYTFGAGFDVTG